MASCPCCTAGCRCTGYSTTRGSMPVSMPTAGCTPLLRVLALRTTNGRSCSPVGSGSTWRRLNCRIARSAKARVEYHTNALPFDSWLTLSRTITSSMTLPTVSKKGRSCSSVQLFGMFPTNNLIASGAHPAGGVSVGSESCPSTEEDPRFTLAAVGMFANASPAGTQASEPIAILGTRPCRIAARCCSRRRLCSAASIHFTTMGDSMPSQMYLLSRASIAATAS
mmetsp:Transcript_31833/g.70723  ORF Transcript_31833/g.70723 Transcript_31833/m.70723 type:complete len:224 (+) Transcript_31833:2754-3425(+)